jgi:putative phage-type endonuclease
MLTNEQREFRLTGVGGSDIAAIWGINPYAQAIDVFYDKRPDLIEAHGYQPREVDGFATARGSIFEDAVAELYTQQTGTKLRRSNQMHRHPKYEWLIANIDRKVEGERKVVEIKTVTNYLASRWGATGTDEVADYYLPQPHAYMLVLDYDAAEVAAMIGMDELRTYPLVRDPEMDELIIETTHDFWRNHVLKGEPPEIDADHKTAGDVLRRCYAGTDGSEVLLPSDAAHWHAVLQDAADHAKRYQAIADGARAHLLKLMGNAATARILGVDGAYSRRLVSKKAFEMQATSYVNFRFSEKG